VDPHDIRTAFAPIILALIGTGGVLIPNQVIITVITPDDLIGSVTALTVGLRCQAQVIGLALFYNRFTTEVKKNAFKYIVPAIVGAGVFNVKVITDFVNALIAVPYRDYAVAIPQLSNPKNYASVLEASIKTYSESFKSVWYITIAFGVAACVASTCLGDVSQYMDNHVAVVM
jgi:Fungal trichothecene efflux pump (TRI12)